jgi:hypothetical protein
VEGEGYCQISSDGCAVDIFDDLFESDGGIVLRRVDGVDGMRIGIGNCGKEMKIAGCQGCGGVNDSAYSRVVGITQLRAKLENDVGEGRTDWNWQGAAVGDTICREDLWGLPGWNSEHVDNRRLPGSSRMCGRVGSKDGLTHAVLNVG